MLILEFVIIELTIARDKKIEISYPKLNEEKIN